MILGVGRDESEHQLFAPLQARQASGPISLALTLGSVCPGACDRPIPCSSDKAPVSDTIQHKGQRAPVYFGLETFK